MLTQATAGTLMMRSKAYATCCISLNSTTNARSD
jgi:hypothetical protein